MARWTASSTVARRCTVLSRLGSTEVHWGPTASSPLLAIAAWRGVRADGPRSPLFLPLAVSILPAFATAVPSPTK